MASYQNVLTCLLPLIATLIAQVFASDNSMYPFSCSDASNGCLALLYHNNKLGLQLKEVAHFYNVSPDYISQFPRGDRLDYVIGAVASCKNINGTNAYFYNAPYSVQQNDTFETVSELIYSGQAWRGGDETFVPGNVVEMHLLSGCVASNSQLVITYTVQKNDKIEDIANIFSSTVSGIQSMNSMLITDPNTLVAGWVLYVPVQIDVGVPSPAPYSMN